MRGIEKVYQFLDEAQTYYLATVEGDQPRVRPFGTALLYEGRLQTGKVKNVLRLCKSAQILPSEMSKGPVHETDQRDHRYIILRCTKRKRQLPAGHSGSGTIICLHFICSSYCAAFL